MNNAHRNALRRQRSQLHKDLEPKKLLPYLASILDDTDEQEVKGKGTREDRCDKLLEILPRRGPNAFDAFVEALKNVQEFLVGPLLQEVEREEKLAEMKNELTRARTHSARLREEITSIGTHLDSEKHKHEHTKKELEELKSMHQAMIKQFQSDFSTMSFEIKQLKEARKKDAKKLKEEKEQKAGLEKEIDCILIERDRIATFLSEMERNGKTPPFLQKNRSINIDDSVFDEISRDESLQERQRSEGEKWEHDETLKCPRIYDVETSRRQTLSERCLPNGLGDIRLSSVISEGLLDNDETIQELLRERDSLEMKCKELEQVILDNESTETKSECHKVTLDRATSPLSADLERIEVTPCDKCRLLQEQYEVLISERDQLNLTNQSLEEKTRQLECRAKEITDKLEREKIALTTKVRSMEEQYERTFQNHANEIRNTKMEMTEQHLLVMKDLQNQNSELSNRAEKERQEVLRIKAELDKERESNRAQQRDHDKLRKKLQSEKKQLKQKLEQETKTKKEADKEAERFVMEMKENEKRAACELTRFKETISVLQDKCETLNEDLNLWKSLKGRVFNYKKDFDRNGVIYALGTAFGTSSWVNPSCLSTGVRVYRSSGYQGEASDLLETRKGTCSCTRDEERSWWCVDLGEHYTFFPTVYTLRHGRDNGLSIIRNWKLEGSRDGHRWTVLKVHENDRGMKGAYPFYTGTWSIDGQVSAMRYFRVFQTGKNSSGRYALYLSGFEIYGVLVDMRA